MRGEGQESHVEAEREREGGDKEVGRQYWAREIPLPCHLCHKRRPQPNFPHVIKK